MKRFAVALSLVALSAYGIGCEQKPAEKVEVKQTTEGGTEVKHTDEAGHTTTTEVKPEEKPAEAAAPTEAAPAEAAPAETKPAEEKPAEEKPADEKPAEEKPAN